MKVLTNPGSYNEEEKELADVMEVDTYYIDSRMSEQVFSYAEKVSAQNAALIDMLVEKGVLTLEDCQALGAPHMVPAK